MLMWLLLLMMRYWWTLVIWNVDSQKNR